MPKGYWIGRVDVHDEDGYKPYVAANSDIFKKYGARPIVRGGRFMKRLKATGSHAQRRDRVQGL